MYLLTVEAAPYLWFLLLACPFLFLLYFYIYMQHSDCGCSMDLCSDTVFFCIVWCSFSNISFNIFENWADANDFNISFLVAIDVIWAQPHINSLKIIFVLSICSLVSTEFQQCLIAYLLAILRSFGAFSQSTLFLTILRNFVISACWHFRLLLPFQFILSGLIKIDPSLNLWRSFYWQFFSFCELSTLILYFLCFNKLLIQRRAIPFF